MDESSEEMGGAMGMRSFGYARVSSPDQNLDRQFRQFVRWGVPRERIFSEKASGKNFERPVWKTLLELMEPGDVLVVASIDRLGRSYRDIVETWHELVRERKVDVVVLDMPLLDTRGGVDGLTGAFLAELVLQVLSYVAELERENIRKRQAEGIRAAQARGVRFGRPPKEPPKHFGEILELFKAGQLTRADAARRCGVCVKTFDRWRKVDDR